VSQAVQDVARGLPAHDERWLAAVHAAGAAVISRAVYLPAGAAGLGPPAYARYEHRRSYSGILAAMAGPAAEILATGMFDIPSANRIRTQLHDIAADLDVNLTEAWNEVRALVAQHRDTIIRVAWHLAARGKLSGEEIDAIVSPWRARTLTDCA
jgi:hypothetical protein